MFHIIEERNKIMRIQLLCDAYAFIDRTVEHYKQAAQVRELGDKLLEIDRIIKKTSFDSLFGRKLVWAPWDSDVFWMIEDSRQYPFRMEDTPRSLWGSFWIDLAGAIDLNGWIGSQIAVYAVMRWLQLHSERASAAKEIVSIAPVNIVAPLIQVLDKYAVPDRETIMCLCRMLGPGLYMAPYEDNVALALCEVCKSDRAVDPYKLDHKRAILSELYPELDRQFYFVSGNEE